MRYKVTAIQYNTPERLVIIRLEDGRVIKTPPDRLGRRLSVGETGVVVQGHTRTYFKPDAIEVDYNAS